MSQKRLEFEMALTGADRDQPLAEAVTMAARVAGCDLLFVLPAPDGRGAAAMVRLIENGRSELLQVRAADGRLAIAEEGEIDDGLLGFARASIDVLERVRADESLVAPLRAAVG